MTKKLSLLLIGALAGVCMPVSVQGAVQQDVLLNNSSQIRTMSNNPFFGTQQDIAGVNFHYLGAGLAAGSLVNGVGFDNVNLTGAVPPTGPFVLNANVPNITLSLNLGFTSDNTERQQNLAAGGTSAAALNTVANTMFYVGGTHPTPQMSFSGLGANRNVYVQLIGGDQGWNGDLAVTANGVGVGANWTTVADSNMNVGSLFAFNTTTSATGALDLGFNIASGNFAGISGIVLSGEGFVAAPPPPTQAPLTNTAQILAPDAAYDTLAAAVNFRYSTQSGVAAPGSVNGISFQDIDWLAAGPQALAQGGTISIVGPGGDRSRFQNTATTITGTDELVLESIANTINFLGAGESVTFNLTGLDPDTDVRVQLIGGDAGSGLNNWRGDFDVTANGESALWDIVADDNSTTASLLTIFATTDGVGNLQITLDQVGATASPFAGIAGLTVTQAAAAVPEPTSIALWTLLGAVGLIAAYWRRRR